MNQRERMTHRKRRAVGPVGLTLLRPWFRYSEARRAFVFRLSSRHGPVFVRRDRHKPGD